MSTLSTRYFQGIGRWLVSDRRINGSGVGQQRLSHADQWKEHDTEEVPVDDSLFCYRDDYHHTASGQTGARLSAYRTDTKKHHSFSSRLC